MILEEAPIESATIFCIGKISQLIFAKLSVPPIKIQTDLSKSLPRINEYPISKETLQGIKPTRENYKPQGLIISFTSPCNTPILLARKHKG